jgi:hypothetical protein
MAEATPTQMRIFVGHSHKDDKACHAHVVALRDAGADVWYDEHNLTSARYGPTIERELRARYSLSCFRRCSGLILGRR